MTKSKLRTVKDVSDEAWDEAWKVATDLGCKHGEAVNKMLLEYGELKSQIKKQTFVELMKNSYEEQKDADDEALYKDAQEKLVRETIENGLMSRPGMLVQCFHGKNKDEINRKIIFWQMNFLREQGGLEPLPEPRDKPWWMLWG